MKKTILLLLALGVNFLTTYGQGFNLLNYYENSSFNFRDSAKVMADSLFTYAPVFGFSSNDAMVKLFENDIDGTDFHHAVYRQSYYGYPIESTMMTLISKKGIVLNASGFWTPGLNLIHTPSITEATALLAAMSHVGAVKYNWQDTALRMR